MRLIQNDKPSPQVDEIQCPKCKSKQIMEWKPAWEPRSSSIRLMFMEKPEPLAKPRGFQCSNCVHIWKNTYPEHVWRPWVKKQGPSLEQELDSLRKIARGRRRK